MTTLLASILFLFNSILVPVQYSDRSLSYTDGQMAGFVAEVEAYFNRQYGQEEGFHIAVTDTVTLRHPLSYYGANSVQFKDRMLYEAVVDACVELNRNVDFSMFDNDSDGAVDLVILFSAGEGEDDGDGDESIWPHNEFLSSDKVSLSLDGVRIDRYAVCNETHAGEFAGIGKICHEICHALGLPDLYDTDGEGSGGLFMPLFAHRSIMDSGYLNADGFLPPDFMGFEKLELGITGAKQLEEGYCTLSPSDSVLAVNRGESGEQYLLENSQGSLLLCHIDRSEAGAGWSDYFGREVSAAQRWSANQVNCNPARPCATLSLVHGDHISGFTFNDGSRSTLCLEDIRNVPDGGVGFSVYKAIDIVYSEFFQDGAALEFTLSGPYNNPRACKVEWMQENRILFTSKPEHFGETCHVSLREGLKPLQSYICRITAFTAEGHSCVLEIPFRTRYFRDGNIPFIYLGNTASSTRMSEGRVFPLKVYNMPDAVNTTWFFDGIQLTSGWFTVTRSGELKAVITREDGSEEVLLKKITME